MASKSNAKPLKIGLVLDTSLDSTQGVPQYVTHIGEWLRSHGNDVHYLVGETKRQDLFNIHSLSKNIAVSFNGSRTTIPLPTSRRKLRQFMRDNHFDVLHVQTPHHPLLAQRLVLAAPPDTAVIGTFHILPYGWLARAGNKLLGIWLRPSLKRFDRMLAVSAAAADFCETSFGLAADVVPNVVDYEQFHAAQALPEFKGKQTNILFLGRLEERKGCRVLLEAIAKIAQSSSMPAFRVIICGKGHLENSLRKFVTGNQLDKIVTFEGFVSEELKPRYYASADIAVFPSSSGESFGIVLLEAMASGRAAVLAGDNPGYRSVMNPEPSLLFPPKSSEQLADKLITYIEDAQRRKTAAAWGEEYSKQFDINVVGRRLLDIYHETLRKRREQ